MRIEECAKLMRQAEWRTGVTVRVLAKKWGVTPKHARKISAKASRRVAGELDAESAKVFVNHALERVVVDGLKSHDPKDRANVVNAGKALAALVGAQAPVRIKHELEGYERMTEEEREAELKRLVAMVKI